MNQVPKDSRYNLITLIFSEGLAFTYVRYFFVYDFDVVVQQ